VGNTNVHDILDRLITLEKKFDASGKRADASDRRADASVRRVEVLEAEL